MASALAEEVAREPAETGPCAFCARTGKLRWSEVYPPSRWVNIDEPFRITLWTCRWCEASTTRWRNRIFGKPEPPHGPAPRKAGKGKGKGGAS